MSISHQGRHTLLKYFLGFGSFCRVGLGSRSSLKLMDFMSFVKEESTEEVKRYSLYSAKAGGPFLRFRIGEKSVGLSMWLHSRMCYVILLGSWDPRPWGSWPELRNRRSANLKGPRHMHSEDMHANWASHIIFHLLDSGMTLGGMMGTSRKTEWKHD